MSAALKNINTIKVVGAVALAGGCVLGAYKIGSIIKNRRQQAASALLLADVNYQIATQIYNALNPNFFTEGGTNEQALYDAAMRITDWEKVNLAYARLFDKRNLTKDLEAELSAEELQTFLNFAQRANASNQKRTDGYMPTKHGKYKFYQTTKRGTTTFKVGDKLTGQGTALVTYKIDDFPNGTSKNLAGHFMLNLIAQVVLDKDGKTYTIFNVTSSSGDKFWVHNSVFNLSLNGLTIMGI